MHGAARAPADAGAAGHADHRPRTRSAEAYRLVAPGLHGAAGQGREGGSFRAVLVRQVSRATFPPITLRKLNHTRRGGGRGSWGSSSDRSGTDHKEKGMNFTPFCGGMGRTLHKASTRRSVVGFTIPIRPFVFRRCENPRRVPPPPRPVFHLISPPLNNLHRSTVEPTIVSSVWSPPAGGEDERPERLAGPAEAPSRVTVRYVLRAEDVATGREWLVFPRYLDFR